MANTTGVISGGIKWTGLASGTDFGSVVDKLVAIEERSITRQETWKAEWQEKITAISGLNTRLVTLKMDAQDKDMRPELLSRVTSVSDEKVVSVKNTSTASLGNYDVTVGEKIAEKFASRSWAEAAPIQYDGTGNLKITLGGGLAAGGKEWELVPITGGSGYAAEGYYSIGTDSSLEKLAAEINQVTAGEGVKASVITDKTRNGTVYKRLVLTAEEGGAVNRIAVANDPTGLGLGSNWADDPVYTTFLGSDVEVSVDNASYTGTVNKTFTFMPATTGTLGTDSIVIQWADTEGHSGKFTLEPQSPPAQTVTVTQGLTLTFDLGGGQGRFVQNESFTVDCQAPILQKGQDSGLAQSEKVVHDGFVDLISPIHSGIPAEFVYSYRGEVRRVAVSDGMSLSMLAEAINNATDNPGVAASIVNDGTGTSTAYHLILTGDDTGAENSISILAPDTPISSGVFGPGTFSKSREATNCMVKVDGFPAGTDNWLQRNRNEVADVIDGVVMTVNAVGTAVLSVRNDSQGMADKIAQLVNSVNYCKSYILEYTKWGGSNLNVSMTDSGQVVTSRDTANGIMIGNYGFQMAQSNLDSLMNSSFVPFPADPSLSTSERIEARQKFLDDNGLTYASLTEIGITSDPENQGLYKVEQAKLLECIQADPEAVLKLFTFSGTYIDKDAAGKDVEVPIKGLALNMAEKTAKLTSDTDVYDTDGTLLQKGKGILVTLQENYESIIENINAKIAREERRIEMVRQRLTDKFNRLEVALQQLEDQQSKLDSSIQSLNSGSD
ncbi:MAG: flagellar filament capping protein FliD [Deltaproteobacteria bacterium]|jgi:flagellar hook-associated protein 2|nr:flagellar filament capping protein FliD [Deltaproteobacteria bacterium]